MSVGTSNSVLLSYPGCPPFVQQTVRALHDASLLSKFITTFVYQPDTVLGTVLRSGLRAVMKEPEKQLARRQISTAIPSSVLKLHPFHEIVRTAVSKSPLGPISADIVWEKAELWFDQMVSAKLNGEKIIYGYEHAAMKSFEAQKRRGGLCIYEMPICHYSTTSALLDPEYQKFPELNTKLDQHLKRHAGRRNARKEKELQLADLVIVNSKFTSDSIVRAGVPEERIALIPLGAPTPVQRTTQKDPNRFVFLSAGTQCVRKGTHYLLEAWRKLRPAEGVELWLIGHMDLPERLLENLPGNVTIKKTVPKAELTEIYLAADALIFPSLVEGFGMVITEAMAHGLPVITTENTGGPGLIQQGHNGFFVPVRDADALADRMQWCLDNRSELREIGERARETTEKWQWSDYRAALGNTVSAFINQEL